MYRLRLAAAAVLYSVLAYAADQPANQPITLPEVNSTAIIGLIGTVVTLVVREIAKEVRARKIKQLGTGEHTPTEREWLRERVEKLEKQVRDLIDTVTAREAEMARLRFQVAELEQHNTELTQQIASRDAVISELQTNVGKLNKSAGA
jgi:predicted RNase H-like nuclease (RuvC/YqgF family)